jgi:uncharacterized protein (TIRG00374 family)
MSANATPENKSEHRKLGLKVLLGLALIGYVLKSKMVDFSALAGVLWSPANLALSLFFLLLTTIICSYRWFLLTRVQNLNLNFYEVFELMMIGVFFNTFMPGAVGGDLIKAYYIAGQTPQKKTKAIFTVLADRLIGLVIIVGYSAFTLLFFTEWVSRQNELKAVALAIWGFTGLCIFFATIFFSPLWDKLKWVHSLFNYLSRIEKLKKIIDAGLAYRHHFKIIFYSLLLSAFSIFLTNIMYSLIAAKLGIDQSMAFYFFVIPLGLTISAIPLLPGGIGVGQVAFYNLFLWLGAPGEQGATLCTVLQIYTILFNCLGAYYYFKFKKKPVLATSSI